MATLVVSFIHHIHSPLKCWFPCPGQSGRQAHDSMEQDKPQQKSEHSRGTYGSSASYSITPTPPRFDTSSNE